ncbi:hypothetical protein AVEN_180577-1 [Araneus ventricosus]|uniref:Uncharacterized protein n=1 Tax=Araneus ventricosus TaxID=182803 RepID=A0A4Y2PJR5_ARAVE|nr:hypothetical protein AVEN_180577-1 [Araneus ventricosus]
MEEKDHHFLTPSTTSFPILNFCFCRSVDDIRSDSEDGHTLHHQDESSSDFSVDEGPQPFSQRELNGLVRGLGLSKDGVELLGSRLKNKNLLTPGTSLSWAKEVLCTEYDSSECRIFIDSSKTSLKAVLLHNGNSFASFPLGRSVHLEENYNDLYMILEKINYQEYHWMVCGDFKMITMQLGQQAGYTKYPCFLCLWDSRPRDLHSSKTDWSLLGALTPGEKMS